MLDLRPKLLLHPNLPMPLHGLNPRTLKGQPWWNEKRQEAYAKNDYHCWACGTHKSEAKFHSWLEAHEDYSIDYTIGRMEIREITSLCHACHNFIHSGRMYNMLEAGATSRTYVEAVLKHGIGVLQSAKLPMNGHALTVCEMTGLAYYQASAVCLEHGVKEVPTSKVAWSDWRMVLDGVEYAPLWKNEQEHAEHYARMNTY